MKKRFTAFALAAALCLGLAVPASAAGFSDVPAGHWAYEQINQAVADGIVGGYQDGSFQPSRPVSYGAFSLMLARAFYPGELAAYSGSGAGEAVMNRHGIFEDTGRASRSSGADLPREGMAQMMYNVLKDKGTGIPSVQEQCSHISAISDYNNVEYNCRTGVLVCYSLGLLTGQSDGSFGPKNSMNRAQAAVVIGRLRDYVQNNGGSAGVVEIPAGTEPKAQPVPEVTDGPLFKLLDGETAQQMMNRVNTSTTYREGYLTNGRPITEENIKELLEKFEETMPEGTTWDESSTFNYASPSMGWKIACGAFGVAISDALFDESAPVTRHQNYDQLKVGDYITFENYKTGYNHGMVVTSLTSKWNNAYDTCDGNRSGKVSWDSHGGYEIFDNPDFTIWIYSRY